MRRNGIHFAGAVFIVLCLSSMTWGQMQKGDTLLDFDGGMELRLYNDYQLKIANFGVGPKYLLTNGLAVGIGARLYKTTLTLNGSLTCFLNMKPGSQTFLPYVGIVGGTIGEKGAGLKWDSEVGLRCDIAKSIAISVSLSYGRTFRHRSHLTKYTSLGGLFKVSTQR